MFTRRKPSPIEGVHPPWQDDELTAAQTQGRYWRWAFVGALMLAVLPWGKIYWDDTRSLIETIVVVFDAQGQMVAYGPPGQFSVDEAMLVGWLGEWVEWVQSRSDDPVLDARHWHKAEQMTAEGAVDQLQAQKKTIEQARQAESGNPMRVTVQLTHYQRESASRYRLFWTQTATPTYGRDGVTQEWHGDFEIKFLQQLDHRGRWQLSQALLNANPRVVYVTWYHLAPKMDAIRP